jgi:hypothetical protein
MKPKVMKKHQILATGLIASFTLGNSLLSEALGQRPTAPRLFPNKTMAYIRVDDTRELKDKMSQTASGKLLEDPEIKPIIGDLYNGIAQFAQGMQQEIGVNLDELLSIPNGELAFALVATKEDPVPCILIEAGDEIPAVQLMLDKAEGRIAARGGERTIKTVGRIDITQLGSGRQFAYFIDSGVFVASTSTYIETLAQIWQGSGIDHTPLADNRNFTDILSRCVGTEGERPQISFFVDPIAIARESLKRSPSSFIALTAMKTLGLDGIKGVGGSVILGTNEFDSIVHFHILLDTNRQGVLRALRPKSGATDPELWVDDSVVSYMTINWDVQRTVKAVEEIANTFGGENFFEDNFIKNASRALNLDFRKEILEQMNDRVTMAQVVLPDKRINSQSNVFGIHVKDADQVKTYVLPKLFEAARRTDSRWTSKQTGDYTIYYQDRRISSETLRAPRPAFTIAGNHVILSDALESVERALTVYEGGEDLLADSIEYKLIRDKIKEQLKGAEFSTMAYQRPDEQLRLFYDLANDPANMDRMEEMSATNPIFVPLVSALKGRKLPPFEKISKYMVPSGAFLTEEENGLHYTAFSLKRE